MTDEDESTRPTSLVLPKAEGNATLKASTGFKVGAYVWGFKLVAVDEYKTADVSSGVAQIGSDPSNDLALSDPTVSRFHCEVRLDGERALVKDLGSTNGTLLDGVRIEAGYLRPNSVLQLGNAKVKFTPVDERHPVLLSEASRFGELVGSSDAMRAAFRLLERAAKTDSTLIIEGETGTGKSRAAEALHSASARAAAPFMVVDCGSMPGTLLEAELFGHEKGAFTGATARRLGVFEEAAGGTVLLDEIGELPLELQPRLLRVLESKEIRRLGQNKWTKVDVRILAATHRDLRQDVNSGKFRQDLYFRLAVARVKLPPLREHPEDIEAVALSLLASLRATKDTHPRLFEPAFLESLRTPTWTGNVRELRNYLERCLLYDEPAPLTDTAKSLPVIGDAVVNYEAARQAALDAFEKQFVPSLLKRHQGKVTAAAQEAGIDRAYLYRLMSKHGLKAK